MKENNDQIFKEKFQKPIFENKEEKDGAYINPGTAFLDADQYVENVFEEKEEQEEELDTMPGFIELDEYEDLPELKKIGVHKPKETKLDKGYAEDNKMRLADALRVEKVLAVEEKEEKKEEERKEEKNLYLPSDVLEAMKCIIGDKRSASKDYYAPLQKAAGEVMNMKFDTKADAMQAFASMSKLLMSAIKYRDSRKGSRWTGKGKERAAWADTILTKMVEFCEKQEPVFMYHMTEYWDKTMIDESGNYPEPLKTWLLKQNERIAKEAGADPKKVTLHQHTYSNYVATKYIEETKDYCKKWNSTFVESGTTDQATRVAPLFMGLSDTLILKNGEPIGKESREFIEEQNKNIELMKSTRIEDRAKVLDPIVQKIIDMKIDPRFVDPKYAVKHMHEIKYIANMLNIAELVFSGSNFDYHDKINAAYLDTLPPEVLKKFRYVMDTVSNVATSVETALSNCLNVGEMGFFDYGQKDAMEKALSAPKLGDYTDKLLKAVDGQNAQIEYIEEYKDNKTKINKRRKYYAIGSSETQVPEGVTVLTDFYEQVNIEAIRTVQQEKTEFKNMINTSVDLKEEQKKFGISHNSEILSKLAIKDGGFSDTYVEEKKQVWKDNMPDLAPLKDEEIIKKNLSVIDRNFEGIRETGKRNEMIKKALDTAELSMQDLDSLKDEYNANLKVIEYLKKDILAKQKDVVSRSARKEYESKNELKTREQKQAHKKCGEDAAEEFAKKVSESYKPPKYDGATHEEKVKGFIKQQKMLNPDFNEEHADLIYTSTQEFFARSAYAYTSEDKNKVQKENGINDSNTIDRELFGPLMKPVHYTPFGEFETEQDRQNYLNNEKVKQCSLTRKKNKESAEEIKKMTKQFMIDLFNDTNEYRAEVTSRDYFIKNPMEYVKTEKFLYYSNIKKSSFPEVKEAFDEFQKEHPEAAAWLDRRMDDNEGQYAVAGINIVNGVSERKTNYRERFLKTTQEQKDGGQGTILAYEEMHKEALKKCEKKPTL